MLVLMQSVQNSDRKKCDLRDSETSLFGSLDHSSREKGNRSIGDAHSNDCQQTISNLTCTDFHQSFQPYPEVHDFDIQQEPTINATMTVFCPLNQPRCKRSIMMSNEPFLKQECPISKGRKCAFAPAVCPMIYQDKEECYWTKIQEAVSQGGCKVKKQPPLIAELCKGKNDQISPEQKSGNTPYPPPNCAELPPCTRCPFGRPSGDAKGSADSTNKRRQKKGNEPRTSFKSEDIKVAATPNQSRLNLGNPEIPFLPRGKKSRKTLKGPSAGLTKTEDIKVLACPCPGGLPPSQRAESQVTSPEKREKIFREAIADKVAKLSKNREPLLVPQCSSSSRRPMPCAGCLVDFLSLPPLATQPESNYVYKSNKSLDEDRCRLNRILATCPALRVPSMCPKGCFCPDVALVEGEDDDDESCPFAMVATASKPKTKPSHTCPLTRLPNHPLILDATRIPDKGGAFDACKCPLIPNNCCYTLPGCPVHTMRAIIDCPNIINS